MGANRNKDSKQWVRLAKLGPDSKTGCEQKLFFDLSAKKKLSRLIDIYGLY